MKETKLIEIIQKLCDQFMLEIYTTYIKIFMNIYKKSYVLIFFIIKLLIERDMEETKRVYCYSPHKK